MNGDRRSRERKEPESKNVERGKTLWTVGPDITADLSRRPSRQPWAKKRHNGPNVVLLVEVAARSQGRQVHLLNVTAATVAEGMASFGGSHAWQR
jgi:hypothetical protein